MAEIKLRVRRIFQPYVQRRQRFAVMVAHRRCGKTVACIQDLLIEAMSLELQPGWAPGKFAYVGPYLGQAKEVAWEYLKRFSEPIITNKNEGELWVEIAPTNARIRIHGADNPDRLRGAYLDGVILDEFADMRPSVYGSIVRPMLADRLGWATFIGTPKGRNEFFKVWQKAQGDPDWYSAAFRASETGLIDAQELIDAAKDMTPEEYAQEWECSFDASIIGAYYGKEIAEAERAGRICQVPVVPGAVIQTAWDLGIGDSTVIWVFQVVRGEVRVLDVYCNNGYGLEHYVEWLAKRGWQREDTVHWLPHDAKVRELISGKSRVEYLHETLGLKVEIVPEHKIDDGINALRILFPTIFWNVETCGEGIEALRQYRAEFDEKKKAFATSPRHDWTSHWADAARYMAVAARSIAPKPKPKSELPIGLPLNRLTMDQLHELEDHERSDRRERL